jgi:hypothetical protein
MLSDSLVADGYPVQFVVLSDVNASDFTSLLSVPLFRDPTGARAAWAEMEPGAVKHDTFVFAPSGDRTLFWDTSANDLGDWMSEIRAAVVALGK